VKEAIDAALKAHQIMDGLIVELGDLDPSDLTFRAKFDELRRAVEQHIQEEESVLFDMAEDALSIEDLERMGDDFDSRKVELDAETRPSPRQPAHV
jgi:hemerythrin-like domain-containing protein